LTWPDVRAAGYPSISTRGVISATTRGNMVNLNFGFYFRFTRDRSKDEMAKVAIEKLRALETAKKNTGGTHGTGDGAGDPGKTQ